MAAVWGASGQVCTCGTRVLVHESIHDEFVDSDRRRHRGHAHRPGLRPDEPDGPGGVGRAAGAGQAATSPSARTRAPSSSSAAAPRRRGLLPRADGLHRRAQRHAHRPGGDLRPGDGRSCRSRSEEEAYAIANDVELRPRRRRVDERPQPGPPGDPGAARRHGLGQHVPDGVPDACPTAASSSRATAATSAPTSLDELTQIKSVWMANG